MLAAIAAVLLASAAPAQTVTIAIDASQDRRAIDPRIYGVNFGSDALHADLRFPLRRHGGNSTTRYNWELDTHNTAFDWFFQNIVDGDGVNLPAGSTANQFVAATRAQGGDAIVTLSMIGWTPKDRQKRWGFSVAKYGPQTSNECIAAGFPFWCTADSGNGECTSGPNCVDGTIRNNDPLDTSKPVGVPFAADWVSHLVSQHGTADAGGVKFYALDNEPMLWNSTHRDVHPVPPDYDEVWTKGLATALAVKQRDPGAKVLGPDTWGYCDLYTSAKDAAVGPSCTNGADRAAHGGLPFVEWYTKQVCDYANANGGQLPVDYIDVHWYPQDFLNDADAASTARRLRMLKSLYHPSYVDESWIGANVRLIPQLRDWIDARCANAKPGIAITEYNYGPDDSPTGALAQAEALAIFGREGVSLATRWTAPEPGTRTVDAFRMFLDYDGANSRVIGTSVRATSSNIDEVSSYAVQADDGRLFVLLFNKATTAKVTQITYATPPTGLMQMYRFDATTRFAPAGQPIEATLSAVNIGPRAALLVVYTPAVETPLFAHGFE